MRRKNIKLIESLEEKLGNSRGDSGSFFFIREDNLWSLYGKKYTEEEKDAFIKTLSPKAKVILFEETKTYNLINEPIIN